jgi:hypothetical protein
LAETARFLDALVLRWLCVSHLALFAFLPVSIEKGRQRLRRLPQKIPSGSGV